MLFVAVGAAATIFVNSEGEVRIEEGSPKPETEVVVDPSVNIVDPRVTVP